MGRRVELREGVEVGAIALALVLLVAVGLGVERDGKPAPSLDPAGNSVPHHVPALEGAALAMKIARADPSTGRFFTDGDAAVIDTYATSTEMSGPDTQGVVLRIAFPEPYAFSGSFPETERPREGDVFLVGTMRWKAMHVQRLLIAVDLRKQKVVNLVPDPTDGRAVIEVLSSSIPEDAIYGD